MERIDRDDLVARTRGRMREEDIPIGTDDPLLLALGATPFPQETCPTCGGSGLAPWPGFCQSCGAALSPPNATSCAACGASDYDEGPMIGTPIPCPSCSPQGVSDTEKEKR